MMMVEGGKGSGGRREERGGKGGGRDRGVDGRERRREREEGRGGGLWCVNMCWFEHVFTSAQAYASGCAIVEADKQQNQLYY